MITKPKTRVRSRFNHEYAYPHYFSGVSKTQTHQADDADINKLVARFTRAGMSPAQDPAKAGNFLDLTTPGLDNLMDAEKLLADAHNAFMSLPSGTRLAFNNNAATMVEWLKDPKNHPQAVESGLLPPSVLPKAKEPPKTPETPPTPPQGGGGG